MDILALGLEKTTHKDNNATRSGYKQTELGEIPEDWEVVELKDVCELRSSDILPVGNKYLGLEHLAQGKPLILGYDFSDNFLSSKNAFFKGDLLYGKLRPNLKKAVLAPFDGFCSTEILPILSKPRTTNAYLLNVFHTDYFTDYVISTSSGTKMPRTSWELMRTYQLILPPLDEQQRIVSILSKIDATIAVTNKIIEQLHQLKQELMEELLTRGIGHTKFKKTELGEIPVAWEVVKLGQIANIRRGASPRPISDQKYFGGEVGWVRIADVTRSGLYLRETEQYLSKLGESKSVRVRPGDLIMSICATIGIPIILDMDACIHDGFVLFSNVDPKVDEFYLLNWLKKLESYFEKYAQPGAQKNLNTDIVKMAKITLPSLAEQKQIASILSNINTKIEKELEYRTGLENLKKDLMRDLLSGRVRIPATR